jgi:hypothetical protein
MKRYTILHPLWMSFFSGSLYRDVGRTWRGAAFTYLLLLLALNWIPFMVRLQIGLVRFVKNDAPALVRQIPSVRIQKGEVSTDVQTPYFINAPKTGKPLAIIDLTGQYTSLDNSEAKILLTKTRAIIRQSPTETRIYDLSYIQSFSLDRARVESWLSVLKIWFVVLAYPLALLLSFAYRIVQALIYAVIGLVFSKILRASLSYPALVRLAVIAVTPAVWIDTARGLLGIRVPFWWPICFAIAMVYLFYGVHACSVQEAAPQVSGGIAPSAPL